MPELPEVETVRRGLEPVILGQTTTKVVIREPRLRWPVPEKLATVMRGRQIESIQRRAKYVILGLSGKTQVAVMVHLGMSGVVRWLPAAAPAGKHEHIVVHFDNGFTLRYQDPRRFGAWWLVAGNPADHERLRNLGPEPDAADFNGAYLHAQATHRRTPVKSLLMDGRVVVGVGNIYASESLFRAGISPIRAANRISAKRYEALAVAVKATIAEAIEAGGTTLRDFHSSAGKPGYFQQHLTVYGRDAQACTRCDGQIRKRVIAQRSTFYCPRCQR